MKALLDPPMERMVTLTMTHSEAKVLKNLAPNIDYRALTAIGACSELATKGAKVFNDIRETLVKAL